MTKPSAFSHDADGRLSSVPAEATIVLTVHNRRDMLLEAVGLALRQTVPVHVIVADDASSDGVGEALAQAFPDVTYLRSDESRGPCFQRNRGIEVASTKVVFPLDDDSMLVDPSTIATALCGFADPTVGIVAMPFRNSLQSYQIVQPFAPGEADNCFDFVACSHGVLRQAVIDCGGYNEALFYMGEETDLALRMFDRGWYSIVVDSPPINHLQPPVRRSFRPDYYGRRNDLLFVFQRVPVRYLLPALVRKVARGLRFSITTGRMKSLLQGYRDAVRDFVAGGVPRQAVSLDTYRAYLQAQRR